MEALEIELDESGTCVADKVIKGKPQFDRMKKMRGEVRRIETREGVIERELVPVMLGVVERRLLADKITGTLYCPESGRCLSSNARRLA